MDYPILLGLTLVQFVLGAYSVFLARVLAMGVNPLFLIASGNLVTFVFLAPFSVALERKNWPKKVTAWLMLQLLLISLGGGAAFPVLLLLGMEKTSPTISSAMPNLSPGIIFIIAACFRFEKVDFRCNYTRAKVLGTLVCITGAIAMSFSQSPSVSPSSLMLASIIGIEDWTIGCIYLLFAVFITSCTVVLQAQMMGELPAPLSLCSITSLVGAIIVATFQVITEKKLDAGSPDISVESVTCISILGGIVAGACIAFQMWCMKKTGPVLVSMFSPVGTVCTFVISALTLGQLLSLGSLAGMLVMVAGLYLVLWAKNKEAFLTIVDEVIANEANENDIEKPLLY